MSAPAEIVTRVHEALQKPIFFFELLRDLDDVPYRTIIEAWSEVRETMVLDRDIHGRYWLSSITVTDKGN